MIERKVDQPPANTQPSASDLLGIAPLAPPVHKPADRVGSPEPEPPSFPEPPPRSILGCRGEAITDFGGSTLGSTLLPYNNLTVDWPHSSSTTMSYPAVTVSQVATFPDSLDSWVRLQQGNYDPGRELNILHGIEEAIPSVGGSAFDPTAADWNLGGSISATIPAYIPMNWIQIPQRRHDNGRQQRGFKPSDPISFSINGRRGINLGDALSQKFEGLDGRDDPVLEGASGPISCRLLVGSP